MDQRAMAAKQFAKNQVKKVTDYFKPTENVRVRDFVREVPGAVGQMFSGTRDTVVKGGKILGEGLAYATSPNVRKMYQAGNTNILPTVSNTTPRQMLGNTTKSAMEILPVSKIKGLATAAMSAKLAPRMIAGGAMGYGYDVADRFSRPEPISQSTFNPGIATLAGALMGGLSKPTAQMIGQTGREIGDDIRNLNPANRLSHRVVDKYDYEPVPGVFAPGGIQQQRPIMESFRKEVETTQMPFEPKSYLARVLMGKQSPVGNTVEDVTKKYGEGAKGMAEDALKYKSAEEFVKSKTPVFRSSKESFSAEKVNADYGIPVAKTKETAEIFNRGGRNIEDLYIEPGAKVLRELPPEFKVGDNFDTDIVAYAKKNGFDVIDLKPERNAGIEELRVVNPEMVKTKSQLTDLWKKATKK